MIAESALYPVVLAMTAAVPSSDSIARLTPMMAQYVEIKAANPDSLLFYRMGDFYELFFADAEEASRALGITLTKRGKHLGEDIPMCGVPFHAADDYLQKLIALGYRVAVCEQTEDPANAKKRGHKAVVRRDVVRLVTPGTITEEKLLDPATSNYLCTLARLNKQDYALAWIDISTGQFRVMETDSGRLVSDIVRIDPSELVVAEPVFHDPAIRPLLDGLKTAISPQPTVLFESTAAGSTLERYYNVKSLDGFASFSKVELVAAAAALAYVEKTQIGERPALQRPTTETAASTLLIDAATRTNLELIRTLSGEKTGSLLHAINRTASGAGARLLTDRLINPLTDPIEISARQDEIAFFISNGRLCEDVRKILSGGSDLLRALSRLALNRGGPRDIGAILAGLERANALVALFSTFDLSATHLVRALQHLGSPDGKLIEQLSAALDETLPLLKRDGGFIRQGYDASLDELTALRDQSRRVIAGLQAQYAEETGVKSLKIRHNNVLGYFIEVTAVNASPLTTDRAKETFIHRQTMANAMRFTTTELADLETRIANAASQALDLELAHFDRLTAAVLDQQDALQALAGALASIDVAASFAVLAEEQGYCRPLVDDSLALDIVAGRHPVVEQMLRQQAQHPFVANDCRLGPESEEHAGRLWLLTGPNMGGKSTFLRQNALIVILAQMGSFVPAGSAHIGIVDRLFSRVGAADDLARGRSTFMVEMVETAAILNQAGARSMVILDEIGRGTATFDGLSIAWAAIEHLHEVNRCRTLFATHYHELTSLAEPLTRLHNATLKVKEWEGDVVFLHEVVAGSADRSYGIQVAQLAGLPTAVVLRAREVLTQLEEHDRQAPAALLIDELPLFNARATKPTPADPKSAALIETLEGANPDEMTPRDALQCLYDLKSLINQRL